MTGETRYSVSEPKGSPVTGLLIPLIKNPLGSIMSLSRQNCGDIVSFKLFGEPENVIQINHPELVRQVMVDNQKNYAKSKAYIRFRSVGGLGLINSDGEKWKRDRQKIQPMFNREQISNYYFNVTNLVTEKYKKRWLQLTENGKAEVNLTEEMVKITTEIILRSIFGQKISDEAVTSLYQSYNVMLDYLKTIRVIYNVDSRRLFCHPAYFKFKKERDNIDHHIKTLTDQYRANPLYDRYNMLSLLIEAQKADPENFSERDIRDQAVTMVFNGFETTSLLMQWLWYLVDDFADAGKKLRTEILTTIPCAATHDSSSLTFAEVQKLDYAGMVIKETLRLYPPIPIVSREAKEDDYFGDFKVKKGSSVIIPIIAMHRNPKYWEHPNSFIPERFLPENEAKIDDGMYLPFMHGGRKCSGHAFVDMEARTIIAKFLSLFKVVILNKVDNKIEPGITLKPKNPLMAEISRYN